MRGIALTTSTPEGARQPNGGLRLETDAQALQLRWMFSWKQQGDSFLLLDLGVILGVALFRFPNEDPNITSSHFLPQSKSVLNLRCDTIPSNAFLRVKCCSK